jgi:hypothetical protein
MCLWRCKIARLFSEGIYSLQNSASGGEEFGAALQTLLQRAMSTVYSAQLLSIGDALISYLKAKLLSQL